MAELLSPPRELAAKSCVAGTRFGKWTVLGEAPKRYGNRYSLVRCDCGEQRAVQRNTLVSGRSKSCRRCSGLKLQCSVGNRFGRLMVLGDAPRTLDGVRQILVRCDCGITKTVTPSTLFAGTTVSCGCFAKERATTHGLTKHGQRPPLYRAWQRMRTRCTNRKFPRFPDWGGRGICVCERWTDFPTYLADMGPTWRPGLTLERIDNHGNYEPGNCRWATRKEQARNKRNNVIVDTPFGRMSIAEAAERSGIPTSTLYSRHQTGRPLLPQLR